MARETTSGSASSNAFIPSSLRPQPTQPGDDVPLPTQSSPQEIGKQANEALGSMLRRRMGIGGEDCPAFGREQVFAASRQVLSAVMDGEAVLLDLHSGVYYSLNRVGAAVWEMLDGRKSMAEIHSAVCNRFDVSDTTAWGDICALIRDLQDNKLVNVMTAGDDACEQRKP